MKKREKGKNEWKSKRKENRKDYVVNCTSVSQVSSVFKLKTESYHQLQIILNISYKVMYYIKEKEYFTWLDILSACMSMHQLTV